MFRHLDTDADAQLTLQELYDLEHDQNEHCIKPFLDLCDTDRLVSLNKKVMTFLPQTSHIFIHKYSPLTSIALIFEEKKNYIMFAK